MAAIGAASIRACEEPWQDARPKHQGGPHLHASHFFRDLQEWDLIRVGSIPAASDHAEESTRPIGPNPRAIADDIWAKLVGPD